MIMLAGHFRVVQSSSWGLLYGARNRERVQMVYFSEVFQRSLEVIPRYHAYCHELLTKTKSTGYLPHQHFYIALPKHNLVRLPSLPSTSVTTTHST